MAGASNLPVRSICGPPSLPGLGLSDHVNYWRERIPAVMITDTAFYRNPRYHTGEDLPNTLDYERMAKAAEGVCAAVLGLSFSESH
jgi:hypothetical protein